MYVYNTDWEYYCHTEYVKILNLIFGDGKQERLYYNTGNPISCMYAALEILMFVLHQNRYSIFGGGKQLEYASLLQTKWHHRIIYTWYNTGNTTSYIQHWKTHIDLSTRCPLGAI